MEKMRIKIKTILTTAEFDQKFDRHGYLHKKTKRYETQHVTHYTYYTRSSKFNQPLSLK